MLPILVLGARVGALAVLHTWTRALLYHPHVHMLVTAGGISIDSYRWVQPRNPTFLVPVKALSIIFAAKMCAALRKAGLLHHVDSEVWKKPWVVHCRHAGSGEKVLDYLGRYVFRIAITNNRLERFHDGRITFSYRDNRTHQIMRATISGVEFLQRFLQHVLPRGCTKVRYYGIFSPHCRGHLNQARGQIPTSFPPTPPPVPSTGSADYPVSRCPHCHIGTLVLIGTVQPQRSRSP